jgi:lipopolysaccharide transport system ATP-binding protein
MNDVAIKVENLGKRYKIGARQEGYRTLRETLTGFFTRPFRRRRQTAHKGHWSKGEDFWALKDISLEVKRGEVVGIIGRNGAGKTTLLKVLSRITEPTVGRAEIHGRVGSLLEVGTGFHPELTGRENIYLNGAILGMRKAEINRKFDDIIAFAEVEKFLDTPVKRYSSGMYVRLAFAVAANLDPDILLVDEVLAVGDAAFQKKCLGKMDEVAKGGRTVLFVSHNMSAVKQLCPRSIMLDLGHIVAEGESDYIIDRYLQSGNNIQASLISTESLRRSGTGTGKIVRVELKNKNGFNSNIIGIGEPLQIEMHVTLLNKLPSLVAGIEVKSKTGVPLLNLRSDSLGKYFGPYSSGDTIIFTFKIPSLPFYPGIYNIEPWFGEKKGKRIDHLHDGINFVLEPKGNFKSEMMIQPGRGVILIDFECNEYLAASN